MTTITDAGKAAVTPSPQPEVAQRARHRIARRLLPFLFLLYVLAFLDRMNVGAAALQMPHDLGFSEGVIGFGAGIFFLGYFLLEIPGALIVERWGARRWIARIMITWGLMTVLMAFIHTSRQFYIVRFLVGAAEAGFLPGVIVYLTYWFRYQDRAKAVAFFYAANPLSYVIGSPLAGLLLGLSWLGMRGWRWLFIIEGIPAVVVGVITLWYLTDWPRQADWLPADEKLWITTELQREKEAKKLRHSYSVSQALRHRDVILLTACYFCAMTGSYGIAFWLPTILKRLSGKSDFQVTLLAALPYIAAFIAQQMNGWHSDRTRERRWHAAIPVFLCGVALALAVVYSTNLPVSMGLFVIAGGSFYGFQPVFWAVPTTFLSESAAAASIGLINSVGNLGGFVGPMVMGHLAHRTHSFSAGLLYLVASLFVSGGLMLVVGRQASVGQVSLSLKGGRGFMLRSTISLVAGTFIGCILAMGADNSAAHSFTLYVGNSRGDDISIIDLASLKVTGEIKAGERVHGVCVQADGKRLFATVESDHTLRIIDTASRQTIATVRVSGRPNQCAATPDGKYVAVPIRDGDSVDIVDVKQEKIVKNLPIKEPHNALNTGSNRYIYVSSMAGHEIDLIDLEKMDYAAHIPSGGRPRPYVVSSDGNTMYVAVAEFHGFVIVDIPGKKVLERVEIPSEHATLRKLEYESQDTLTHGLALTPDGSELWVSSLLDDSMYIYDVKAKKVTGRVRTGVGPNWIVFTPDGKYACISNTDTDDVSIIDVKSRQEVTRVKVGKVPKRLAVATALPTASRLR